LCSSSLLFLWLRLAVRLVDSDGGHRPCVRTRPPPGAPGIPSPPSPQTPPPHVTLGPWPKCPESHGVCVGSGKGIGMGTKAGAWSLEAAIGGGPAQRGRLRHTRSPLGAGSGAGPLPEGKGWGCNFGRVSVYRSSTTAPDFPPLRGNQRNDFHQKLAVSLVSPAGAGPAELAPAGDSYAMRA
jgi:hypothetical protein